jgi:hypothetical protein
LVGTTEILFLIYKLPTLKSTAGIPLVVRTEFAFKSCYEYKIGVFLGYV